MGHTGLLVTLVFAVGVAVVGAVLAARLGQSVILGYILAGVVIGPYTPGFVGDPTAVKDLADVGIILLMFTIGVHLSVRDLVRAGTVALVGGVAQVLVTVGVGYAVGLALGWPSAQALFFGAVIAISSSAVLSKIIEEHGDGDSEHGRIALAWSTVQDLATIALVVVLSAVAGTGSNLLTDLLMGTGKALLFLAILIPLGLIVLPRLFERVAALQSREVFVLLVAAVALGIAYASSFFGVSLALGAFVAGIVVGESDLSHQILGAILPLRDIFAALFFVSVGMLVDPAFVARHWPLVLLTVALIVLLKGALVAGLVALFRYPARTALFAGVLMAQAGEFSFLLARLGADLHAVSSALFSLMLAGAVVSIVLAPTLYRAAAPLTACRRPRRYHRGCRALSDRVGPEHRPPHRSGRHRRLARRAARAHPRRARRGPRHRGACRVSLSPGGHAPVSVNTDRRSGRSPTARRSCGTPPTPRAWRRCRSGRSRRPARPG
jgi:monovalent cation:H+ antiporter-2, CPA2 family